MTTITQFAHLAIKNKNIVSQSIKAGCYHCSKIFDIKEIQNYTDNGQTVICPFCGIDAVIGDMCGVVLTEELLNKANKFWFKK
jgi:hypothetical protein